MRLVSLSLLLSPFFLVSCNQDKLPILGDEQIKEGKKAKHMIGNFQLYDQDSNVVTLKKLDGKIHIAGFMFLSCPTICPKMTIEMKKVYDATKSMDEVVLLSYSIDTYRDSVPRLKNYANELGLQTDKWHFLTGDEDSILALAESYYATAYPDSTAPGGFTHSGGLLLIDKNRHIRGVYDGTKAIETQRLISDIKTLVKEN